MSTPGTLYVVATPLGNLEDLSDRARRILCDVPVVAAEDTRRARILLQHVGAHPQLLSYHAHSPPRRLDEVVEVLAKGQDVALLTDAGTPTVSDPGVALVRRARELGAPTVAVVGPSAVTAALSVSGLPADRYAFMGFAPRKGKARKRILQAVAESPWTVVLFESPERLVGLLEDLKECCGHDREAAVARELTKVHEELKSGTLSELAAYYEQRPPRGEVTVLVAGSPPGAARVDEQQVRDHAAALLAQGMSRRDVAARLTSEFDCSRNEAYRLVADL